MYGNLGKSGLLNITSDLPLNDPTLRILFNQATAQLFGFNNVEAYRNYRTTVNRNSDCALCHWGVAASFSPNINYDIENQTKLNDALNKALSLVNSAQQSTSLSTSLKRSLTKSTKSLSAKTIHLIRSFAQLIAPDNHIDSPSSIYRLRWSNALCGSESERTTSDMILNDPDVAAFCASSLMSLTPWNYYASTSSWPPNSPLKTSLMSAKQLLLNSVHRGRNGSPHAFSIHLLIHLLEPSNAPLSFRWEALKPTLLLFNNQSAELVPSQGHLTHMPAHLFLRVGMYNDGVLTSAVSADRDNVRYIEKCLNPYGHGHNLKMYVANARLAGRMYDAVSHARKATLLNAGTEITPNNGTHCVDCAGIGSPEVVLTFVRFARWEQILKETVPTDWGLQELKGYHEAAYRYARAVAYWALSKNSQMKVALQRVPRRSKQKQSRRNQTMVELGDEEAALCRKASVRAVSASFNYTAILPHQLSAARAMYISQSPDPSSNNPSSILSSYFQADFRLAIAHLRLVTSADDENIYLEPPRVWYPPRECLGSLLLYAPTLEMGQNVTEALIMFQEDLVSFVESPWSLIGAAKACEMLGKKELAKNYTRRAEIAWRGSELPLPVTPCLELLSGL